jgi:hypothetical protein
MSSGAQEAHRHFASLVGEEGGSLYFEQFLRSGCDAWPEPLRRRYAGLSAWKGVAGLKHSLRTLAGVHPDLPLLLAGRSAQLMKLAARLLFHPCENVLVADTGWPAYHAILERECRDRGRTITQVSLRDAILREQAAEDEVIALLRSAFRENHCDGLFLAAVSNEGVRLPVEQIVRTVRSCGQLRFVVVDGAQDFCHVYPDLRHECCDLYLAGAHKWLGAYYPLALGFYGRRGSQLVVETVLKCMTEDGCLDDPLLRFVSQLQGEALDGHAETVNLAPLFSCHGAIADAAGPGPAGPRSFMQRTDNAQRAAEASRGTGWSPLLPGPAFRSGILLFQAESREARQAPSQVLRERLHERGLALTAYGDGVIRLSMPSAPWSGSELELLRDALRKAA